MAHLLNFCLALIVAFVQAAVVREESPLWNNHAIHQMPEYRAAATVTTVVTTTATGPTTITINKRFDCAKLEAPSATTLCRRKRQYWNLPLFVDHVFVSQDDIQQQYQPLKPTHVIQVEPSSLPDYRNGMAIRPYQSQPQFISPFSIQSSLDKPSSQPAYRVADPIFGAFYAFSSLLSNLFSGIFRPQPTPAVLVTSTSTVYTTTATATSTTSTATYTIKGAQCLPAGVAVCPGSDTAAAVTSSTTASSTSTSTTASTTSAGTTTTPDPTTSTTAATTSTTTGSTPTSTDSTTASSTTTTESTTTTSTTPAATTASGKK
uniref:Uncharacterized protein n=1 Tax=Daphnia galeata TaxID=27404 RepID=A0A8J2WKA6_9CRUS|nr:unnamed protein product [Daphnia galeata]